MNLTDLKLKALDKSSQIIVFDQKGSILDSDEKIVSVKNTSYNIFSDTMFCGMEESILNLRADQEITFDCINTDVFGKDSQYDFVIRRIEGKDEKFAWIIYDFKKQYDKIFELQQERNLAEMQASRLKRKNTKLADENQIIENLYSELLKDDSSEYVLIKTDNLLVNVQMNKILYLEAYGDYIKVHTEDSKVYVTHNTMKNVEDLLPKGRFFRIHRSYLVALDKITNIEQMSLLIKEKILPIGKSYKTLLIEKMKKI